MRTIGSSSRRRGISSILGTIIFVGIMFTAVIPMFLVMNQADTFYEKAKFEVGWLDEDKRREDIHVYVFPTPDYTPPSGLSSLTVRVENRGELLVRVVRVWVNDNPIESDSSVQAMSRIDMDPFDFLAEPDSSYSIKVTTDRGNEFASDSGTIKYLGGGEWETGMLVINVLIYYAPGGVYEIEVKQGSESGDHIIGSPYILHKSSGSAFTYFDVSYLDSPNTYHIKITRGSDVIYKKLVDINWPVGPPVVWVFA